MTGVRGLLLLAVLSAGSPVTGGLLAAAAFGKPLPEDSSCELIGANGEVTVNLAGGQIESCSFADDFNRLLYVPRAGYRYGTDPFKQGGVALVRKAFFKTLMSFARQLMLGGRLPRHQAFRNIEAIEEAYRQSDRALNDDAVLSFLMDRIVFPTA